MGGPEPSTKSRWLAVRGVPPLDQLHARCRHDPQLIVVRIQPRQRLGVTAQPFPTVQHGVYDLVGAGATDGRAVAHLDAPNLMGAAMLDET